MKPRFFASKSDFREWLEKNHDTVPELWVEYYKKKTGIPSITWPESVDEALCFGWIDGIRKSIDEQRYKIRFTPRREDSNWSAVNIQRVEELKKQGLMRPPGIKAFKNKKGKNSEQYSYEGRNVKLKKEYQNKIKSNNKAWKFFKALAPSYRKASVTWVMSAKKEETRERRLGVLIKSSEQGQKIPPLVISKKNK